MVQTKKQNRISLSGLWLTVILLVILILATLVLLGSFISAFVQGDPNVVEIMASSNALKKEYGDGLPVGALPGMETSWETETSVDLFKTAYTGPDGSITVESAGGDKLIAPGTSHTYTFTLKNTGNISLDYTLVLEGVFQLSGKAIPIFVRLHTDGEWLIGSGQDWIHVDELKAQTIRDTLPSGQSAVYHFQWQWPFEADATTEAFLQDLNDTLLTYDRNDTAIGDAAAWVNAEFRLNMAVTSQLTPGAMAEYPSGITVLSRVLLNCTMALLILGSGLWLILLLFWRRRVYLTGILTPALPGTAKLGRKEAPLEQGRFIFEKARFGKRKLMLPTGAQKVRIRRDRKVKGLRFAGEAEMTVIHLGKHIEAVELYFVGGTLNMLQWAAIDKDRNVYTPLGVTPPDPATDINTTPGGLCVNRQGEYTVRIHTAS